MTHNASAFVIGQDANEIEKSIYTFFTRATLFEITRVFIYVFLYLFMIYLKTSVAQIVQRRMLELVNNELETVWKKAVVA
jgi:hypothetical protein